MTARPAGGWRGARAALVVVALAVAPTGCKEVEESSSSSYSPATLEAVGDTGLKRVTFTPEAAARVDLTSTVAVRDGRHTAVDYAALIYDGKGVAWVYTVPRPLTFLRTRVAVDRVTGNRVLLSGGLRAGTRVVTVGATEVYGAELDIAGSH